MLQSAPVYIGPAVPNTATESVPLAEFERLAQDWIYDGEYRQFSKRTLEQRRFIVEKLTWWLRKNSCTHVGLTELRRFFTYVGQGHEAPGGRWGNRHKTKAVRPRTVRNYFVVTETLFRFLVAEGMIQSNPMARLQRPIFRANQIEPFTDEQVLGLLKAASRTKHSERDQAILQLLLDTGLRASELCNLRLRDVDVMGGCATVMGKGNKSRVVSFDRVASRALRAYLRTRVEPTIDDLLFESERGEALTRSGLLQIVRRLGKSAGIQAHQCSPHVFRHTFAISFLRAGGNVFNLKAMLGHQTLFMSNHYCALAETDVKDQHRRFSPANRLASRAERGRP